MVRRMVDLMTQNKPEITGHELRARRKALRLSQTALADMLDVNWNTIARWERGKMAISHGKILKIAMDALAGILPPNAKGCSDGFDKPLLRGAEAYSRFLTGEEG
jgi:transcriptional regulator with XRE-family HTH domain